MITKQKKLSGFLLILLGSSVLWFVSKYKDVYQERSEILIVWENVPKDVSLPEDSKQIKFNALLKERGFSLLWHKLFIKHLNLDFNTSTFQRNDSVFINPKKVLERLNEEQMSKRVISASKEDLYIPVDRISSKKVRVVKNFDIDYSSNFQPVKVLGFDPDSVVIYGDKKILENISQISIESAPITVIDTISETTFALKEYYDDITFDTPTVDYIVHAAEMTEGSVEIAIQIINQPENVDVKLLPDSVTVFYTTTVRDFSSVDQSDFSVIIDYNLVQDNNTAVAPKVEVLSNKVNSVRLDNEMIQVLTIL